MLNDDSTGGKDDSDSKLCESCMSFDSEQETFIHCSATEARYCDPNPDLNSSNSIGKGSFLLEWFRPQRTAHTDSVDVSKEFCTRQT